MANYLTPFQQFQGRHYGNILPEQQDRNEEYEYWNLENREQSEWIEKQADEQLQENQN